MNDDGEWRNVWHGITVAPAARAIFPGSSSAPSSSKRMFFNRPLRSTGRGTRPRALYKDLAYFLIDLSWPRLALALATSYFGVIFLFGLLFFFICQECDNLFDGYNLSYQAFSTIGFGVVYSRDRCGNYVTILESYVSMVLLPTFAGIIFTKFSLPKVQVAFSNKCCIQPNYQGQHSALVVRVANASSSPNLNLDVIMDAVFTMELFSVHETVLRRHKLALKQSDFIFFRLALELVHVIDESSPLHGMPFTANCMLHVTVTGIDSNRHATIVNQMSYTSDRVAVGAKFDSMLSHDLATNHVVMDFEKLSCVVSVETCSIAPHMAAAAPGRTPTSSSSPEFVDASSPQHHDGVSWDQPEAELAAAATASDQPFVEPGMTGILFKDSSGRALHRQATMSDGGSYVHIDDTISMLHRVRPKNVPHRFQYLYYHILHAKWVSIVAGIFILTATVTVFFAVLHWVHFPGGLFLMADMLPPRNSPFELCMYLSVHTFSTIGYGTIAPAPGDNYHNALVAVEAMCGLTVATILTGIFWSKFALPQAHIQFSPAMAVSMYQSQRCLVFRAVNTRNVGDIQLCQFKLGAFSTDRSGARRMYDLPLVQPTWPSINMPATLVHVIDESSPLRRHNDDELNATSLLALFSGFDSTFCETVYARQIYTTYEFGKQFENSVTLTPDDVGVEWSQVSLDNHLPMK
ncbi:hypothetical protein H310_14068 [Aphanomyces invadans]|uniref:Inward rectifier potassium channel C-terminal domain-containing protein n=1 Tax=Aphanomyces invadans TaxID=157072 RepID=A0A024TCW7_9STRA|nr:hypothetical protein H310_14068 [Aphanomyces invadans]ETV91401.1 hypothetical protein H310_14068 [Aphanomyces invadans]|eukprot:XP_008880029.1 hypothetical protein H310_14068 [Aphanomyces invadans]